MKHIVRLALFLLPLSAAAATIVFPTPTKFGNDGVTQYPSNAKALTASDTDTFDTAVMVYVGSGGNVAVTTAAGVSVTFVGVPTGSFVPVKVTAVKSTGTTASSLVAVY